MRKTENVYGHRGSSRQTYQAKEALQPWQWEENAIGFFFLSAKKKKKIGRATQGNVFHIFDQRRPYLDTTLKKKSSNLRLFKK